MKLQNDLLGDLMTDEEIKSLASDALKKMEEAILALLGNHLYHMK